jgi:hypothetical protein
MKSTYHVTNSNYLTYDRTVLANGKWQNSNGLQFQNRQITNHLPFEFCHLPIEFFVTFTFTFRPFARSAIRGRDPSPVAPRLMRTPERDTLSPMERAVYSPKLRMSSVLVSV